MINTVLLEEPHSTCHLLYANRDDTSIIFKDEFEKLQARFPKRLTVSHILSKPRWTSSFNYWQSGRIDQTVIAKFISEHPPYAQDTQYYLCAPNALLSIIQSGLQSIDVPSDRIHFETFGGKLVTAVAKKDYGNGISVDSSAKGVSGTVTVKLNGETHTVQTKENETLLDNMLANDVDAPYSCQSGVCGTCKCKLADGAVAMRTNMALDDEEIKQGYVLSCQTVCQTNNVQIEIG